MIVLQVTRDINASKMLLASNPTSDEIMYDLSAYHAQQAVEKYLKAYLRKIYNVPEDRKFKTHDIAK